MLALFQNRKHFLGGFRSGCTASHKRRPSKNGQYNSTGSSKIFEVTLSKVSHFS